MALLIGSFLALMLIGVPVAGASALASVLYLVIYGVAPDIIVAQRMIAGVESFPLLAVPFFILAGNLMNVAGATGRIYAFAVALVGWMRGGLAQVNIIGSVIFSGMSGTALADAAGLGTIGIKGRKDHGHPDSLRAQRAGGRGRRRRARDDRDQGEEGPRLLDRVRGRRHRGLGDAGPDHPAV